MCILLLSERSRLTQSGQALARSVEKYILSSETHTLDCMRPGHDWFMVPDPSCKNNTTTVCHWTHIHTHTRIYIHTMPCMLQHLGWTLYPLIVQTEDKTDAPPYTPPAAHFLGHDEDRGEPKQEKLNPRPLSVTCTRAKSYTLLLFFYPLNMHSSEVSPGSSDILCFSTTHTPDFLSLTTRDRGPGRASLSQGLPSLDLHTCVL